MSMRRMRLLLFYALCALPAIIWGTTQALRANMNSPLDWVSATFPPRAEYDAFSERFGPGDVVVLSWDGCTIDEPRLDRLVDVLRRSKMFHATDGTPFFRAVTTGRALMARMMMTPRPVPRADAMSRLRGTFIGPDDRTTRVVITFRHAALRQRRRLVHLIQFVTTKVCQVPARRQYLAGPVIDGLAVDEASKASLNQLAAPSALVVFILACYCLDSMRAGMIVFGLSIFCQGATIALIHYAGQTMNALLIVLPPLIQVLAVAGGVHLTNYYFDSLAKRGPREAPWQALRLGWLPTLLSAGTTALGIGSLMVSKLTPVAQFGVFGSAGVVLTAGLLLSLVPMTLLLWPPRPRVPVAHPPVDSGQCAGPWDWMTDRVQRYHWAVLVVASVSMIGLGYGVRYLTTSVRIETLFADNSRILRDYRWLESHVGPLVPIEVIVQYENRGSVSPSERARQVFAVERALRRIPDVGATLSAAAFIPPIPSRRGAERVDGHQVDAVIRASAPALKAAGRLEESAHEQSWRVTAYVSALDAIDYGEFLARVRSTVAKEIEALPDKASFGTISYTGIMPLVHQIQRQLMRDLFFSFLGALGLISIVMTLAQGGIAAGLVAMIPNVFPILLLFGGLGWSRVPLDIGTVMTASVALGIAVDDTLHFLTFFQRARQFPSSRWEAVRFAYRHCGRAMIQTSLICGLGMLVFGLSDFVPTRRFAWMTTGLVVTALAGDLLLLPALLMSPLGAFFDARGDPRVPPCHLTVPRRNDASRKAVSGQMRTGTSPERSTGNRAA